MVALACLPAPRMLSTSFDQAAARTTTPYPHDFAQQTCPAYRIAAHLSLKNTVLTIQSSPSQLNQGHDHSGVNSPIIQLTTRSRVPNPSLKSQYANIPVPIQSPLIDTSAKVTPNVPPVHMVHVVDLMLVALRDKVLLVDPLPRPVGKVVLSVRLRDAVDVVHANA